MLRTFLLASCALLAITSFTFAGEKNFHDQDLKGRDFSQGSLNNADFSEAIIKNCKFSGASLKKANFKGADITGVWFTDADLTGADLREVKGSPLCSHSHFDNANLEGMELKANDCTFKNANLKDCKISGYIYNNDFSGANLCGANMRAMVVNTDSNRWKGVTYDDDTAWPDGFDPKAVGAVMAKADDAKPAASTDSAKSTTVSAPQAGGSLAGKYVGETNKETSCTLNADGTFVFHEGGKDMTGTYKADGDTVSLVIGDQTVPVKVSGNALLSPANGEKLIKQ